MGMSIAFSVLNIMNKAFNELGDERAVEVIETALDRLVSDDTLTNWQRNVSGRGWVIYTTVDPDGIYIDWNDRGQYAENEDDE